MKSGLRPTLKGVVLAAGLSARLGRPKALERVRGESLIRRTVRVLAASGARDITVVIPPRSVRLRAELSAHRLSFVENARRAAGMSSSVQCALRAARASAAVLLVPVDLAQLDARDLKRLIARFMGARRRVAARRLGTQAAIPLIVPRWLYARGRELSGDRGFKPLLDHLPREQRALIELPSAAFDVDTPADLVRARRSWRLGR